MAWDVLGEILRPLELSSGRCLRAALGEPFSIAVPGEPGAIRLYAVVEGRGIILAPGHLEHVVLGRGDLALLGDVPHTLSSGSGGTSTPLASLLEERGFDGSGPLVFGGPGPRTIVVCGHGALQGVDLAPLVSPLSVVHLRAGEAPDRRWMDAVLRHIERERRRGRPGHEEVVRRLTEILLLEALRAHAARDRGAALAAADPQLGRVLHAMHAEPEAAWSLDRLARMAGQSRTLFVQRFRERMGVSPMRYLAGWRMRRARVLLARPEGSVAEVARRVGYSSESAFHRVFREHVGAPPGVYRRTRREA